MKAYLYFLFSILLFASCNEDNSSLMDEDLLDPRARVAQEFVDHLKKNERFYVLTLVQGYNPDNQNDSDKQLWDNKYQEVQSYTSKYKLKPINKWKVVFDTIHAISTDYTVCFQNIFIPFDVNVAGKEPAFLRIGFDGSTKSEKVTEFEIIFKGSYHDDEHSMKIVHTFSAKQYELLHR